MGPSAGKEPLTVLRRLIAYSGKVFRLSRDVIALVPDRGLQPRISTAAGVKLLAVLFGARMGSLNALELAAELASASDGIACRHGRARPATD